MLKSLSIVAFSFCVSQYAFAGETTNTAVGGGIGGALGSVVGQAVGGSTGAAIGAGVGGAAGGAMTAKSGKKTESDR